MSDSMAPDDADELVRAFVRSLRVEYAGELSARLQELEATWQQLRDYGWELAHMQALHRQAHRLHGSGAMYGFAMLSAAAQPLDILAGTLAARATPPDAGESAALQVLVEEVRAAIVQCLRVAADEAADL